MEKDMAENKSQKPEDVLKEILESLRSDDAVNRLSAIKQLHSLDYSSEAIRNELEKLALNDGNEDVRADALAALDLPIQRHLRSRMNKLGMGNRFTLLNEINEWEKFGLLDKSNASVLRKRYDFDIAPPPAAPQPSAGAQDKPVPVQRAIPTPKQTPAPAPAAQISTPEPVAPPRPKPESRPAEPRPTLLQTLLSETSIKIALYLGAFFVIASAAILAALSPAARLPVLIIATIIFGGLSIAIRKRLPQPSFALFIVFSFLLPITANVLEESLHLSTTFSAIYWVLVSLFMALVWGGSTWLYESRVFSVTSFIAFSIALYRIGDIFDAGSEFYTTTSGLAALAGLIGVWALKKWKDSNFALPLFFTAQLLQIIVLGASLIIFAAQFFETSTTPLWNIASIFTWGFAFLFYAFSDILFPFVFFPWLAALTLLPLPWFPGAAFEMKSLGLTFLFFTWGLILSTASEITHKPESTHKFSLPVLLVSIPTFGLGLLTGFIDSVTLGFVIALGITCIYTALHLLRTRGWLWALALLNFIVAYFAFFNLPFMEKTNIFFGYQLLGLSILFLLPDIFLKNDFKANPAWRLPQRIYGVIFTVLNIILYIAAQEKPLINTAVVFGVYALFFAIYALRYNTAMIGYVSTASLVISILYTLNHFNMEYWLEALTVLAALYFLGGFVLQKNEARAAWRAMLTTSGLALGSIISLVALFTLKQNSGWFVAVIGLLFVIEMYSRKQSLFEMGAQILLPAAVFLIFNDFKLDDFAYIMLGLSLTWLSLDLIFSRTYKEKRLLEFPVKILGAIAALIASIALLGDNDSAKVSICFGIYTGFFTLYTAIQRKAIYGYIPAAYLPLTIFFILDHYKIDAWLPALTGLAILYYVIGIAIRSKEAWSFMLRNSALALGTLLSIGALLALKETGGWYALVIGLLFAAEMYLSRDGWFEIGIPVMFNIGAFLILRDLKITETAYHLLAYSLVWLGTDLLAHLTFAHPRQLKLPVRGIGGMLAIINYGFLFFNADAQTAAVGFGIYTLLFLTISMVYYQPNLFYTFTLTLPLFVAFFFRSFEITKWIHPVIFVAMAYYAAGFFLRFTKRAADWDSTLLYSGLGLGVIVSMAAPIIGGVDAAIPVAFAATLWAVEAFARKNVWLGFPANGLYLLAYFIILIELKVDQPQFFSMGAALLGLLQHYLLTRTGSKTGTFLMGMVSQLILLGTTYIQMVNTEQLIYFVVLFFQSMAVLFYGIVIRSRSLTFTPIVLVVLGVITVLYTALKGLNTVVLIGCTGIILLMLGILAVVMRERITKLGESLSTWKS
jgi:hypothetical protein